MDKIKVLLFAANPRGTAPLDLAREFREIDEEIRLSAFRSAVELILVPGTRPVDLLRKLNENQPQVVHFSSHGSPDEIILESGEAEAPGAYGFSIRSGDERDMKTVRPDETESAGSSQGQPHMVSKSALVNVLRSCNEGNLRLVVLNACNTRPQAEALTEVVDCVVSMNRTITDRAAIKFAASFYGALAFGRSVQTAFDQGVARLSAEGIAESETPELLVRGGVDASRLVIVGPARSTVAAMAAEAPFIVPFPRNGEFVGRDADLMRLRAKLSGPGSGPVGIRPAGLTGMGGIGKTQLVVEYVYLHRDDYPDGIFWIDAAGPLVEGFARLASEHRLKWAGNDLRRDEQIRAAFEALNCRPRALLVLDNLTEPATIAVQLLPGCAPEDLHCTLLFTTRRHDLGRFAGIEVTVLPEEPALRLLLRHPTRQAALDPAHPDHEHARAIARMLGRLPLALELAGAYLGKFSGDVSLEDYREGLKSDGALATLDADAAELTEADLRRVHDPAVAATIREQWESLQDESAQLLLRVASLFSESVAVPIARLGLLAGLGDEARPGRRSPLRRAAQRLDDACLVERLEADQIRLHPLIREFASGQTSPDQVDPFLRQCIAHAAMALEDFPTLEAQAFRRGVYGLQDDLIAILEIDPPPVSDSGTRLQAILRLLQREGNDFRLGGEKFEPTLFAQQVRNRAVSLEIGALESSAAQRLAALGRDHFRLLWKTSRESTALVQILTGHEDLVTAAAVAPDSRHAISGGYDGTIRIWNLATGQLLRSFAGHETAVSALTVAPDGFQALSASHDRTLKLWDLATGQMLRVFSGHEDGVSAVAVARDGRHVLSGGYDGTVRLWDLSNGQLRYTFRPGFASNRFADTWDLATGQPRSDFVGQKCPVSAVALAPDSRHAVSALQDGTLTVYDVATAQFLRSIHGHETTVSAVAVGPDGRHALSGSYDFTLKLWDLANGQLVRSFTGHGDKVSSLAITADGRVALSASYDRTLKLWDLQTGHLLRTLAGHEDAVSAAVFTPDGRLVLSGSHDRTLRLWNLATGDILYDHSSAGHEAEVSAVAATPDCRSVLSGSHDRTLRLWDLASGRIIRCFSGHDDTVSAVAISVDGLRGLSGSYDRALRLWDLQTGHIVRSFIGHEDAVSAVAVTPDGRHALSASHDRTLRLWDLATGQHLRTFAGHERAISAVVVTPDGRSALSASHDRTLRLWNLATGQHLHTFVGHHDKVNWVASTPDGCYAISASSDRTLRLWNLTTGQQLRCFAAHERALSTVAVTADGRHALSGSEDRTLRLWDLSDGVCRAVAVLESSPLAIAMPPIGRTVVVGDRVGNLHHFQINVN
jgi:WD40 repeat protein